MRTFYEFFAGGGMVRIGLGENWQCLFANDIDSDKVACYVKNWGSKGIVCEDVAKLALDNLPGTADLAWTSFPCQDLSLAGSGAGLKGDRSGTFWAFWKLMLSLKIEGRAPRVIVLENVCGALTSHEGKDFSAICSALSRAGYNFGAVIVNAMHFVPQSRPRLFIIAVDSRICIDKCLRTKGPVGPWHTAALCRAFQKVPKTHQSKWIWWRLPEPKERDNVFADLIEKNPTTVKWHTKVETEKLLGMMNDTHLAKVKEVQAFGIAKVGAIYKRTRPDGNGRRTQRAEVRFDDVAGCLRTPAGGSSRQIIMIVEDRNIRTRLLSTREAARLMGLPDTYKLPVKYNDAYHLIGDGVVVPVVRFLASNIFEKLIVPTGLNKREAA